MRDFFMRVFLKCWRQRGQSIRISRLFSLGGCYRVYPNQEIYIMSTFLFLSAIAAGLVLRVWAGAALQAALESNPTLREQMARLAAQRMHGA